MAAKYDVVIIGGGPGGLSSAALLSKWGLKVLLMEKNDRVGGKGVTFSKNGFKYEMWPIAYMPLKDNAFNKLFIELGIEAELKPAWDYDSDEQLVGFYYRGRSGKYNLISDSRPKNTTDPSPLFDLWELDEKEREAALNFMTEMVMLPPDKVAELDDVSMHDYMSRFDIPTPLYDYMAMHSNISILEPVDQACASEQVKVIQELALQGAAGYFKGGYGRLYEVLADTIRSNGGEVRTNVRVERILTTDGSVTGIKTKDELIDADVVVSDVGIQPTVLKLVGEEHFSKSYGDYIKNLVPSYTLLTTRYFLNKRILDRPLYLVYAHDTVCDTERYSKLKEGSGPEDITLWIVVPANYDPEMAPPGKQCLIASTFCSPDPKAKEIEMLWDKIDNMVAKMWPEIMPAIESKERGGPKEVSRLARDQVLPGQGGEAIGLGQIVGQCGSHKPSAKTPIDGLFYVGTDAGGAGVGMVQAAESGINVARMVLEYHQTRDNG